MKKSPHEIVRRTRGRDSGDGADTLYADMGGNELFGGGGDDSLSASGGNNYLDGEACNVLFGRSKREAANDNDYQSFLERSAA